MYYGKKYKAKEIKFIKEENPHRALSAFFINGCGGNDLAIK